MTWLSRTILLQLTLMLFISTICFGADVHYCKSEFKSFSIIEKASPCKSMKEVDENLSPCCKARKRRLEKALEGKLVFKKAKCCHNESVGYKYDSLGGDAPADYLIAPVVAIQQPQFSYELSSYEEVAVSEFLRGPPTQNIVKDFNVFYQVFLI